jgi:hypothetical protein
MENNDDILPKLNNALTEFAKSVGIKMSEKMGERHYELDIKKL